MAGATWKPPALPRPRAGQGSPLSSSSPPTCTLLVRLARRAGRVARIHEVQHPQAPCLTLLAAVQLESHDGGPPNGCIPGDLSSLDNDGEVPVPPVRARIEQRDGLSRQRVVRRYREELAAIARAAGEGQVPLLVRAFQVPRMDVLYLEQAVEDRLGARQYSQRCPALAATNSRSLCAIERRGAPSWLRCACPKGNQILSRQPLPVTDAPRHQASVRTRA